MFWRGRFRGNQRKALLRRAILHPPRTTSQNDNIAAEPRRPRMLLDRRPSDQTTSSTSSSMYERIQNIFDRTWQPGQRQLMAIPEHSSSTSQNNWDQQAADSGTRDDDHRDTSIGTHLMSSPLDQSSPSDHCISIRTEGADSDNPTISSQRIDDTTDWISSSDDESFQTASLRSVDSNKSIYETLASCYSPVSDHHPTTASAIISEHVIRNNMNIPDRRPSQCESAPAILTTKCAPHPPNASTITIVSISDDATGSSTSSWGIPHDTPSSGQSSALVGTFHNVVSSCLLPLGSYLHDDQAHVPPSMSWLNLASDSSADADETLGLQEEMRQCARSAANFLSFFQLLWQSPTISRFTTERMMDEFLLDYRTLVMQQQLIKDRDNNDGHDHQWHN